MKKLRQSMVKVRVAFLQMSHWLAGWLYRLRTVLAIAAIFLILAAWLALSFSGIGITSEIGSAGIPLSANDFSAIPQSVTDDAAELAAKVFREGQEKYNDFVDQLLGAYLESKDKDFIILFNPGGWGWNAVESSPGWQSILNGIESELNGSGYTSLLLHYQRTVDTSQGHINELWEMSNGYSTKAKDLADRVEFLTDHIPDLTVIIAGESNGTIICDTAMNILTENPRVYSIQTGPPFWHTTTMLDRTLVLNDNGITPDSFSQGDFPAIIWGNLKAFFGLSQPEDAYGTILHYVKAPGHDYWWQYPKVSSEINNFLEQNFGIK